MSAIKKQLDMTMKKAIKDLLEADQRWIEIRRGIALHRWKRNAFNEPVDRLEIRIDIAAYNYHDCFELVSRDFEGVIREMNDYIRFAFVKTAERVTSDVVNGYWGVIAL